MAFLAAVLPVVLCQGCTYLQLWSHTYSDHALPVRSFDFADGGHAIYFSFDKRLDFQSPSGNVAPIASFVFVISGSGCTSFAYFLPRYFRGLEGESGPMRIFVLQKRFIEARTWGRVAGCNDAFIRADHPSRWIADQIAFIKAQLRNAKNAGVLPQRIAIIGISEGADIVPAVAQQVAGVTHAAIVANGGMDPIDAYRLQAKKHGLAEAFSVLQALDQTAPADPDDPIHLLGGRTWRYWTELRELRNAQALAALPLPILLGMGEQDQSVPVESAWYLRDYFAVRSKSNLTVLIYPGADHALQTPDRNHLPDFWHVLDLWLDK